ncbi:charged multivesicular body protein 2b isoform X2 [Petromyzon marinus]|uniref:charged multivesicular body protein 2b isoform X2 n=1 Tax=Petromyzon marinus TaxID=7757 RepID=UPI003F7216CF
MEAEIRRMAKSGNSEACRTLARQLVRLRQQRQRSLAVGAQITSVRTQAQLAGSQVKMASAMASTAKTMGSVSKEMDPMKTMKMMEAFNKQNAKMEMSEEMISETLDSMFEESGDEEEGDSIVAQVLDEIGIETSGKMSRAPSASHDLPLPPSSASSSRVSDDDIERQLRALGVD